MQSLLLIDDSPNLYASFCMIARNLNISLSCARTLKSSRGYIQSRQYDCIVLDRCLPDGDGLSILPEILDFSPESAILLLTCKGDVEDRIEGLKRGADDYLPKPFSLEELQLRISVLLHRKKYIKKDIYIIQGVSVHDESCLCTYNGKALKLRKREFLLFQFLLRHHNMMLRRETLYEHIWPFRKYPTSTALDACVKRLRRSLVGTGIIIETGYKIGYRLVVYGTHQTSSLPRACRSGVAAQVQ